MRLYNATNAQLVAEASLRKQGFKFSNWISAQDEAHPDHGCMVLTKRPGPGRTEYREIDPAGNIN